MKSVVKRMVPFVSGIMKSAKFLAVLCVASAFVFASCDKDDDDDTEIKPSIQGDLAYQLPAYAMVGSSYDLEVDEVTEPVTDDVTYRWVSTTLLADTVWGRHCTVIVPDSIGDFSVTLTVSADGYYDKTVTQYITSIKLGENGSLTGIPAAQSTIVDSRDGKEYDITEAGNGSLLWFAENLDWEGAGSAYAKADAVGNILGRLYTWKEATGGVSASGLGNGPQGVCPDGWSIPTKEDWEDLAKALGGESLSFETSWKGLGDNVMVNAFFNGYKFWEYTPDCNPENQFGWAALSAGSCTNDYNNYSGLCSYAFWWCATELSSDKAYYRYIYYNRPDFDVNSTDKGGFGASVRCVKLK